MTTKLTHHCSACGKQYPDGNNTCHPSATVETIVSRRGGPRPGSGRKPRAGTPADREIRFRVSEAEYAEVTSAVPDGELSERCRRLLLASVRRA